MADEKTDPKNTKPVDAPKPAPARALMPIVAGRAADGSPVTTKPGEVLPEDAVAGLTEGTHFTRVDPNAKPPPPPKVDGKDARRALCRIQGIRKGEVYTFAVGDPVPVDQLDGLREGVHFE